MPGEEQGEVRVLGEVAGLAGVVVGVEDEALLVEVLQQHRARAGPPLGVRGGDDHRVRLEEVGLGRGLLEPARELLDRGCGQVVLGEALGPVLLAHRGGVEGGVSVGHAVILPYGTDVVRRGASLRPTWH